MIRKMAMAAAMAAVLGVAGTAMAARKAPSRTPREVTGVVNITNASPKELELLPGVGRRTATAIVAHREKQQFQVPADLMKVKGVGPGIYGKVKTHLTVSGPTTLALKKGPAKAAAEPPAAGSQGTVGPLARH